MYNRTMKTILITGASSGIGYETSLLFARQGYAVYAAVKNLKSEGAERLRMLSENEKLSLKTIQIDVTKQVEIDHNKDICKTVDILVNNAGFGFLGAVEDFTIEEIKKQFEVNYYGAIRMTQAVLPYMRERKDGRIINISSINGLISFPLYGVYSSSKFALETLSEALSFELKTFHIHVSLIEPGSFLTNFTKNKKFPKAQSNLDSPYHPMTYKFFGKFIHFDIKRKQGYFAKMMHPYRVAKRILAVAEHPKPPFHNVVGIDAHILLFLNKILPRAIKIYLLERVYTSKKNK